MQIDDATMVRMLGIFEDVYKRGGTGAAMDMTVILARYACERTGISTGHFADVLECIGMEIVKEGARDACE